MSKHERARQGPPMAHHQVAKEMRKVADHLDPARDARNRHEMLHDMGLIPALKRIEDLIIAGQIHQAQDELAAFIRPEGASRLNIHKAVA